MTPDEQGASPQPYHHFNYLRMLHSLDIWEIARAKRIVVMRMLRTEAFRKRQDERETVGAPYATANYDGTKQRGKS